MTVYSAFTEAQGKAPPRVVKLQPEAFSSKWKGAPRTEIAVGLTLVSAADIETAKTAAATESWHMFPKKEDAAERYDAFRDILVRWLIARGTCDPRDVTKPLPIWKEAPEDIVREALSVEGMKALWDELDLLWTESSPVAQEIDDAGIYDIAVLSEYVFERMPEMNARRIRRLLFACVHEMRNYANPDNEED